ncbi:MAG: PilT protein domain-containing protein [bacterium]|nr:MAG: PilT protein domain-containing protein [bacterium]KAF0149981.1 MAG: PilT protein domain-containing protein [bacterium]KAF0169089.1 MAG: PilT protein domain-containing protein [bacterium]TXT21504.1 MAG: PilT protein domain-containing protein [bacterium]
MGRTEQPRLVHLDTHVVIWLYEGRDEQFSPAARAYIERGPCCISPMVRLELQYLYEVGRNDLDAETVLTALRQIMDLGIARADFDAVVQSALLLTWTRDAFDRLIAANAQHDGALLVTRDQRIREHFAGAVW